MAIRSEVVTNHLEIVELADVCARMRARSLDLFELVGSWVTTTEDGAMQRLLAQACHQHAWHAELWAQRCPTIPVIDLEPATASYRPPIHPVADSERLAKYRRSLADLLVDLAALKSHVDQNLDPNTTRTINLVVRDLSELLKPLGRA